MIGKTLGHFAILSKAGVGGMGEVYRAKDSRLKRTVAIKVLPADVSQDPELRARLNREARILSSINHPHVCALYDIGHDDGIDYLVLEYLEGTPLSARLGSGPLPLPEALALAVQIADGLSAAHRHGIIHRDLKPGNVMLTSGGPKIVDFGLARPRILDEHLGSLVETQPLDDEPLTEEGVVLGTLHYMSPEQLRGKQGDARSDLFSFGVMLYEMVTGIVPFNRPSRAEVIAAILEGAPSAAVEGTPGIPGSLARLIHRCLDKNPDLRYQSARDLMIDLQWIADGGDNAIKVPVAEVGKREMLVPIAGSVAATVLLVVIVGWILLGLGVFTQHRAVPSPPQPTVRASIHLPEGHRIAGWASPTVAITNDGSTIAFVTVSPEDTQQLWVRRLNSQESIRVPDSETAEGPVFSPDGAWVLFAVGVSGMAPNVPPELRKYSLESGLTQTLCPVSDYFGADWRDDRTIVWADQIASGLWRVGADGAKENFLSSLDASGEGRPLLAGWPKFMPDGRRLLVTLFTGSRFMSGGVVDVESGEYRELGMECTAVLPLPDDRLAWVDLQGRLMVAPFPAGNERVTAMGRVVDQNISLGGAGHPVLAVSRNGTAVMTRGPIRGSVRNLTRVVRVERDGSVTPLPLGPSYASSLDLSPQGNRMVLASTTELRIHHLQLGNVTALPLGGLRAFPSSVKWSPDGARIAFIALTDSSSTFDVYTVLADGTSLPRVVFKAESEAVPMAWEADGRTLLVRDLTKGENRRWRVVRVPLSGGAPQALELGVDADWVELSPQGDLMAYVLPQGDLFTVIIRSYPDLGSPLAVASGSYTDAVWSRDGAELLAIDEEGVDVFSILREPHFAIGERHRLTTDIGDLWGLTPDPEGAGLYGLQNVPGAGVITEVEVVVNWVGGLP